MNLVTIDLALTKSVHNFEEMGNYFYLTTVGCLKIKYFKDKLKVALEQDEEARQIMLDLFGFSGELTIFRVKYKDKYNTDYVFDKCTLSYLLENYGPAKVKTFKLDISDVFDKKDVDKIFDREGYYKTRLNEHVVNHKDKFKTRFFNG